MTIATCLLFALGLLGAADIALYHSFSHGIRSHPDSRRELITHSLRGPTYAALFVVIPNFALHGVFFWCLIALLVFDLAISIWDFAIEGESRRFLGGLPSGEYVLHILIAMLFGAFVASVLFSTRGWAELPAQIMYAPAAVPGWLRLALGVMALLVLISGLQDLRAAIRLGGKRQTSASATPEAKSFNAVEAVPTSSPPIIFFDGMCGMCNRFVDIILRADRGGIFRFAPLQGETARKLLPPLPEDAGQWSMLYLDERGLHGQSDASIEVYRRLGGPWAVLGWARFVPGSFRNAIYRSIARNRYRWFGKREACRIPSPGERERFLS